VIRRTKEAAIEVERLTFKEYNDEARVGCESCGWSGAGFDCRAGWYRDEVDLHCPECDAMLLTVGFPGVTPAQSAELRGATSADDRLPPPLSKGLCPFCGAAGGAEPVEDGWKCLTCREEWPTHAYMCAEPACWDFTMGRYCNRHARIREDGS